MMILSHCLVAAFILLFPYWDFWELRRLRKSKAVGVKASFYIRTIAVLWIFTVLVLQVHPLAVYDLAPQFTILSVTVQRFIGLGLSAIVMFLVIAPIVQLSRVSAVRRQRALAALDKSDFLIPQSVYERVLFAALSISAGICEEIICRGFFIGYFQSEPWGWLLAIALLASSALFGIAHAGQGWKGMIGTGLGGLLFGVIYIGTGSLLIPMIVHACVDLRYLVFAMMRRSETIAASSTSGAVATSDR
jgi:membrane protease YdiL (CAAX protease family)